MLSYSKMIFVLKVLFFISATSILVILFIISPPDNFGEPVKVSTLGLEENYDYQISKAKLRGSSDNGHFFNFTVDAVNPDQNNNSHFSLTELVGTLSLNLKEIYTVSAEKASFNAKDKVVELTGNLEIRTNTGITGKSERIRIDFDSNEVVSVGKTTLQTPLGIIEGGSMKVSSSQGLNEGDTQIYFFDGVVMTLSNSKL